MNTPNLFAISGLVIVSAYLPLFILLVRNSQRLIARIYAGHIFSVVLWGVASIFIGTVKDPNIVIAIWAPAYTGVMFVPVFFYHSIWIITKDKHLWKVYLCYGQAFLFTILIFFGVLMKKQDQFLICHSMYFVMPPLKQGIFKLELASGFQRFLHFV